MVFHTASGLVGEACEVAEDQGGAARPDATAAAVVAPLLGGEEEGRSGGISAQVGGGVRGRGTDAAQAVGEREEDELGDGDEGQDHRAEPLPHRQRAPRPLRAATRIKQVRIADLDFVQGRQRKKARASQLGEPPTKSPEEMRELKREAMAALLPSLPAAASTSLLTTRLRGRRRTVSFWGAHTLFRREKKWTAPLLRESGPVPFFL